jgi:hypothetical protein
MMIAGKLLRYRLACLILVPTAAALLASGCLWGVVTDSETGAGLSGVTVTYTDADGNTGSTTTDSHGLYAFDIADGPIPAAGPVSIQASAVGYHPVGLARLVQYNDNPGATLADLSSFWEVQSFDLASSAMKLNTVETLNLDIRTVKQPPLVPGATATYFVRLRTYAQDDPNTPVCDERSAWETVMYPDPPVTAISLNCSAPGEAFRATLTVTVERTWPVGPGVVAEDDISTAELPWVSPADTWSNVLLDSADSEGPDDPDLEFSATVRYRAITVVPLGH